MSRDQSLMPPAGQETRPDVAFCDLDPLSVLKQLLRSNLGQIDDFATKIVREGNADTETIHQLRIVLRRTETVFSQFRDLIPQRKNRWFDKRLTSLRKISNPLRDADILLERIEKHHASGPYNGLKEKAHLAQQMAFPALFSACEKWLRKDQAPEHCTNLLEKLDQKQQDVSDKSTSDRQQLLKRIKDSLSKLGRDIFSGRMSWKGQKTLHQRRIEVKRLRYALELFEPYVPAESFADVHSRLKWLQSRLGDMNDEAIIVVKLRKWSEDDELLAGEVDEIKRLKKDISTELSRHLRKFNTWWTTSRRAKWNQRWQNFVNIIGKKT